MSLRTTNLNLIPILQALLREGNVSRAAVTLGLSQPATSAALSRLRSLMGDPLLVQVGRTMRLTPRAKEMIPSLEQLCSDMESLLQDNAFDPVDSERAFVVAAPDYLVFLLGEAVLDVLRNRAPGISVRFMDMPGSLPEWMAAGELDLAVCADIGLWRELSRLGGFPDRMVGVVAKGHPLLATPGPSEAEINSYPQITFGAGLDRGRAAPAFSSSVPGAAPNPRLRTEQFLVMPFLASQSDCVARLPRSLADRFTELLPVKVIELAGGPSAIDTALFWGPVQEADPGHRWFRGVIADCMRAKFGRPEESPSRTSD